VDARERLAAARTGHLATVRPDGRPHVVVCCFVLLGDTIHTPVDGKPKRTTALQRLRNVEAEPRATFLVDRYDEDWSQLWWVRAEGTARIDATVGEAVRSALVAKYPQYREIALVGPVIALDIASMSQWETPGHGRAVHG
jgi:PPOX class probable F420-dependent enzyme